jgi:hypothetical protein
MKNFWVVIAFAIVLVIACKGNKKEKEELPISAISIIKGQLNKLDSSMYAFIKLERNGNKTDTTFLKREEIRMLAEPFLLLPDISDEKLYAKYVEERLMDVQQNTLSITASLKDGEAAEIQKQILVIGMADQSSGQVQSIYIDRTINSADSTIEQKLFWEIDKYFSIGKIISKENQPEKTYFTKVEWQ